MSGTTVALPPVKLQSTEVHFTERRPLEFNFAYKLLLVFLLVLYSNIAKQLPSLEAMHPAQLVASVALLTLIAERALAWRHFDMVWPESYALLAFVGVAGLSVFEALWVPFAIAWAMDLAKIAAIFYLIVNVVDDDKRLNTVMWCMVLGGLFPALGAIRFWMLGYVVEGRARWHGIFANPNELGYALVVLVPLAATLAVGRRFVWRLALWGVIGIYMLAVYLTLSRGSLIGLVVVLGLVGLRQRSQAMRIAMFAGIVASLLFVAFWWSRGEGFRNIAQDTNVQQRFATYKAGFAMFLDRPWFGVGVGCSSIAWPLYAPEGAWSNHWLHIHNTFIQVLSETGVLGFIPFAIFLTFGIYHAHKLWRLQGRPELGPVPQYAGALEVSMVGFMVCGMSGGFALSWFPYILVGLICAAKKIADDRLPKELFTPAAMKLPRAA